MVSFYYFNSTRKYATLLFHPKTTIMKPITLVLLFTLYPLIFWSQNRLTVDGKVVIDGPDNNGSIAGLEVSSGSQKMIIDGNEMDCLTTGMFLNLNSQNDVFIRTGNRRAELNFGHDSGNGSTLGDTDEKMLTLEYSGLSVVAIAAIQELLEQQRKENANLRSENREMKSQVSQLSDRLDHLEQRLSRSSQTAETTTHSKLEDIGMQIDDRPLLAQNAPNPFRQQTSIQYYIPKTVTRAEIVVFDQNGKKVRTFVLDQAGYGKVTLKGGALPAGNYTYALQLDGALWRSLPMVLTQ